MVEVYQKATEKPFIFLYIDTRADKSDAAAADSNKRGKGRPIGSRNRPKEERVPKDTKRSKDMKIKIGSKQPKDGSSRPGVVGRPRTSSKAKDPSKPRPSKRKKPNSYHPYLDSDGPDELVSDVESSDSSNDSDRIPYAESDHGQGASEPESEHEDETSAANFDDAAAVADSDGSDLEELYSSSSTRGDRMHTDAHTEHDVPQPTASHSQVLPQPLCRPF